VSPALARLIRKSAEHDANGASAIDALSIAAGVQPGELAALQKELQQASKEAMQWRDKFLLKRRELEELRIATASRENENPRRTSRDNSLIGGSAAAHPNVGIRDFRARNTDC
jgi:hypothetical protein